MNLAKRVLSTLRRPDLLPTDARLVVGVSGGTDSLALLHILRELGERLHVATLDHGLRGEASAADARFVVETAQSWGMAVTAGYADVRALADEHAMSVEMGARAARYDFLASVAREIGAKHIAVAHNADDQVETILLHLLRGSGLAGLAGMAYAAPLPGHDDLTLLRPLLDVSRAELDAYCREQGLEPRQDATNADLSYTRNRLRHEAIPYLRQLSPQLDRRLLQLGEIARVEGDYVDQTMHEAIRQHLQRSGGRIVLPRAVFAGLHPALQRRFVLWAAHELDRAADVGMVHIAAAVDVALTGDVGAKAQLKRGVQLRVDYESIVIEHEAAPVDDNLPLLMDGAVIPVALPGTTRINDGWLLISSFAPSEAADLRLDIPEASTLVLRGRQTGDQFAPLGLVGTKKLTNWMVDRKVPRALRERLPVLVVEGEIAAVWWHGWAVSERFAVHESSQRVAYFALMTNFE